MEETLNKKFTNSSGQMIGWLDEEGIFRKRVRRSRHLLKVMNAWGIDKAVVDEIADTCKQIRIFDADSDMVYSCDMETFKTLGVMRDFVGQQVFLPLKYFTVKRK
jgi:hypothetical protein